MKRNLFVLGLLAGCLVSSHSVPGDAAVDRVQVRGEIADLNVFLQTAITCQNGTSGVLNTSLSIQLSFNGVRSSFGNSDTRSLLLFFSEGSSCTGASRDFVAFDEPAAYTQNRVNSASFADSFDLIDEFSGEPMGSLILDVQLTGIGETGNINEHSNFTSGDFVFHSHANGVFRQAIATGTVDLNGTELIDAGQFASLSDMHSGNITVTH
jgi:hypothetical protein